MKQKIKPLVIVVIISIITIPSCRREAADPAPYIAMVERLLYHHERPSEAYAEATRALETFPESAMLYYHRGMAGISLKKADASLDDFAMALRLEPENPMAFNGLGNAFYLKYEDAIAERYYRRGLVLSRDDSTKALFLGNLALLEMSKKKYPAAEKLLREAMGISHDGRYHNLLGRLYLSMNDGKKALETWKTAITDPVISFAQLSFRHNTLYRMAELLFTQRAYAEAMKYCGEALDMSPGTAEYQRLYNRLQRYAK